MKKPFYGWWVLGALIVFSMSGAGTVWYGFTAFFNPLVDEFGWSYTAISLAAGMRGVEIGLGDLIAGFLVERFGGRRVVFAGALLMSAGFLLLSRVSSLLTFYLYYFILCIGVTGCASVVAMTILSRWFPRRLGTAFGIFSAGGGLSGFLLPAIVSLVDSLGFRTSFFILGLIVLFIGSCAAIIVRDHPVPLSPAPNSDMPAAPEHGCHQDGSGESGAPASAHRAIEFEFGEAVRSRAFWVLVVMSMAYMFVLQMVITHIMPYLESTGFPRSTASQVAMAIPSISLLGRLGFGWLGDRFNRRRILILAMSLQVMGVFILGYVSSPRLVVLFLLFYPIGYGGLVPNRAAILKDYFGTRSFGSLLGVLVGLPMVGGLLGPVIAGRLYDTTGSYHYAFMIATGLLILCMLPLFSLRGPGAPSKG